MKPDQFTLWLLGFLDGRTEGLTAVELKLVNERLGSVVAEQVADILQDGKKIAKIRGATPLLFIGDAAGYVPPSLNLQALSDDTISLKSA
jgi:hypothetical protein